MSGLRRIHDDEWQYSSDAEEQATESKFPDLMGASVDLKNMGKKLQALEAKRKAEISEWSREGVLQQLDRGLNEGNGLYPPPHVLPYKTIGVVDVQRDRSLLPKMYQFYKRPRTHHKKKVLVPEEEAPKGETVSLPLSLKNTFWNGDRWCSMSFSPRIAEVANGYQLLHEELVNSQHRLKNTKMGRYFLDGLRVEESRTKSISYPRASKRILTNFRPYIPPLPLANVARYQIDKQIEDNKMLLSLYREEAKRTLHSCKNSEAGTNRSTETAGGLPPKACEELSLKQLESVLDKESKFETLQAKFNFELLKQLVATRSTRPYTFARNFGALKGLRSAKYAVCDMESTPRRTEEFRKTLMRFPWMEVLINLIHHDGRRPSSAEVYIVDHIRFVIKSFGKFEVPQYCNLIRTLERKKLDFNSFCVHRALHFVKESLHISDMDIMTNLLKTKDTRLPYWVEARASLLGKVKRKLESHMFTVNTIASPCNAKTSSTGFFEINILEVTSSGKSSKK